MYGKGASIGSVATVAGALTERFPPPEAVRVARAARRGAEQAGPAGGALLRALRLEAAARGAPAAHAHAALLEALHRAPHHKVRRRPAPPAARKPPLPLTRSPALQWLHVRGAALLGGAGEAGALPDLLLDKQLRLRALPDELQPPPAPPAPSAPSAPSAP